MAKCFKCEKNVKSATTNEEDVWVMPCGVIFEGGFNFGSSIYDAMIDGIHVEIIICDDCLLTAKNTELIREVKKNGTQQGGD